MRPLAEMGVEQLVRPEGWDCACGRHHACPMAYLKIGRGAVENVPDMLAALGRKKPFVVFDAHTRAAAGDRVCGILRSAGVPFTAYEVPGDRIAPAEWETGSIVMHFDPTCDVLLAVGSGVINDLCKVVAHAVGVPSAVVGTAPSMDGYASNSASMEVNHVKVSLYNHAPEGILLDTEILAQAPERMLWAGVGDMIAKYIALCEWRISHLVTGEYYCEEIAAMMRAAVERVVRNAPGIARRDPDAVGAIAEGLVIAGVAMAFAEISRPASGLEHYFSHMWEMMALERNRPYDLHGIQVGVGTALCLKMYEDIRRLTPDRALAEKHMADFDPAAWEAQVRRIFGKTAEEILRIEEKTRKNDPAKHAARLEKLMDRWPEILAIMEEELPDKDGILDLMTSLGMPVTPADIGISVRDVTDAFLGSRDVRDKFLTSSFLWDLGLTDTYAALLEKMNS